MRGPSRRSLYGELKTSVPQKETPPQRVRAGWSLTNHLRPSPQHNGHKSGNRTGLSRAVRVKAIVIGVLQTQRASIGRDRSNSIGPNTYQVIVFSASAQN